MLGLGDGRQRLQRDGRYHSRKVMENVGEIVDDSDAQLRCLGHWVGKECGSRSGDRDG